MKPTVIFGFLAALLFHVEVWAQSYPSRPITLVAPFAAGGDADLSARNLAAAASGHISQPIVVMNRAGASGSIGTQSVRDATPDGYTLLLSRVGSQAILPALQPTLKYKWNDFTFISLLELNPLVCIVKAESPIKTLADLVETLRKNPGKLNYSTSGSATVLNLTPQMIFDIAKLGKDIAVEIPYKGGGEAATAVASGQADFACLNVGPALGLIKGGRVRAIVSTLPERFKDLPDVPTAREAGFPQLEVMVGWSALVGPPNMSKEALDKWVDAMGKISKDPKWIQGTERIGGLPRYTTPQETLKFVEDQVAAYQRLGKVLNLQIQ